LNLDVEIEDGVIAGWCNMETSSTEAGWYWNHKAVFLLYDSNADLSLLLTFQNIHQC
jgi:hypothetical protein